MSALTALSSQYSSRGDSATGVSADSGLILSKWKTAEQHSTVPFSREPLSRKFAELAATWRDERGFSSSLSDLVLSPAYQRIIAMGTPVVPYILLELASKADHWFWALSMITGVDPVPTEAEGNIQAMRRAWINWGEREGLLD